MESSESCLIWRKASPGRLPARKRTMERGVFLCSRCRFCMVYWYRLSMMLVSALFRTSVANPEKRTGMQWSWCTRNAAAGLPLCPLASPADSTAPRDFLCSATLRRMLGMLPEVFRITPTCSASLLKLSQVEVNRLGKKWTATDCSVGPITSIDLLVSFVEDASMCNIHFFYI